LRIKHGPDARPVFPLRVVVDVKALAYELPKERGVPLSRYSTRDLAAAVYEWSGHLLLRAKHRQLGSLG
jgi:hypothetical protein